MLFNFKKNTESNGFTLVKTLVFLMLSGVVLLLGISVLAKISRAGKIQESHNQALVEAQNMGHLLTIKLGGTKSFSNINFRVPGTNYQSLGAGVFISPGKDIYDRTAPDSDTLYVINRLDSASSLAFTGTPFAPPLSRLVGIHPGDFFVLSRVQSADAFLAPTRSANFDAVNQGATSPAIQDSNTPSQRLRGYTMGDQIYRAEIIKIGVDLRKNQLLMQNVRTGTSVPLSRVESFSISYASKEGCSTIRSTDGVFVRSMVLWAAFNSDPSCYRRLSGIRIALKFASGLETFYDFGMN